MAENWQAYGFPDGITFRTAYRPFLGLVKALNERITAEVPPEAGGPMDEPEKFTDMNLVYSENAHYTLALYDQNLVSTAVYYVNPAKIATAQEWEDCFWTLADLAQVAGGADWINTFSGWTRMTPDFPVKWAVQRYNAVNLLRYVPTTSEFDWPDFRYEDISGTFNFKA